MAAKSDGLTRQFGDRVLTVQVVGGPDVHRTVSEQVQALQVQDAYSAMHAVLEMPGVDYVGVAPAPEKQMC